jgi:enterochelin esterase-like enzyme
MNMQHSLPSPAALAAQHPAIAALLGDGPPPADAVDAFLAYHDLPITETGAATFVFRGEAARVEIVLFAANAPREDFLRVPGSDLWILRLPVEDDGRFEYRLAVHRDGGEEWILDPANPHRAGDPRDETSVCSTHGHHRPAGSDANDALAGRIETVEITSETFGETREEQVYLPPGYDPKGIYPLVVIHDGADLADYGNLATSLDDLIAAGDIPPVVAALAQTRDRMGDYPRARRHSRYLVTELLPVLAARYALSILPQDRVLLGANLGAVASISTAFRYPGVFGGLVLKSGAFILDRGKLSRRPHPVFHKTARLARALQRAGTLPGTRAFVSTGELEGAASERRALATFLQERGVDVLSGSAWDGRRWRNWRDQLRDGLTWVLRADPNEI